MLSGWERVFSCWLLAVAIFGGFVTPGLSELLSPYAFVALFVMIILSLLPMARLDVQEIFSLDWSIWKVVLWQLFVLPSIILAAATLAKVHTSVTTLMIVTSSAGSLFASSTFADLLKLNKRKALQCMILSTFMMPVSYFLFFSIILHAETSIELTNFLDRCMTFLVVPLGLFFVFMSFARSIPKAQFEIIERTSRRLTIFALIVFGIGILGPAREMFWQDPWHFFIYLTIVTILGAGMATLTVIVMYRYGFNDALTASIVSGFRNVGLGFALLPNIMTTEAAAYVGISQIPIFLAPLAVNYLVRANQNQPNGFEEQAAF